MNYLSNTLHKYGMTMDRAYKSKTISTLCDEMKNEEVPITKDNLLDRALSNFLWNDYFLIENVSTFVKAFNLSKPWLAFDPIIIFSLPVTINRTTETYQLKIGPRSVHNLFSQNRNEHILHSFDPSYKMKTLFEPDKKNRDETIEKMILELTFLSDEFDLANFDNFKRDILSVYLNENDDLLSLINDVLQQ